MNKIEIEHYFDILNKVIPRISNDSIKTLDEVMSKFHEIFKLLRIARIDAKKTIYGDNKFGIYGMENPIPYTEDEYDPDSAYTVEKVGNNMVFVNYTFYTKKGDSPFTENEKEYLNFVAQLLYLVASNHILNSHVKFSKIHDMRFRDVFNVNYLNIALSKIIEEGRLDDFGIIAFNIHGFSLINKKIGDTAGTNLLGSYYNGITTILGGNDQSEKNGFVSALGGDNGFIVFKKEFKDALVAYLSSTEFNITTDRGNEEYIPIFSHFGINMELEGSDSSRKLLDTVIPPLNIARKTPAVKFIEYDENFKRKYEMSRKVESWYKDALKNEEFIVYYQPKVNLRNYRLSGAEALVRWIHKEIMVYPDQFIPVLENNLSIKYLDLYMLNHVCQHIKEWISAGKEVPQISVNLSRATLGMHNIVDVITTTVDKYGIPRSLIQIELTESASDAENDVLRPLVEGLNKEGISTAVDDFGTGFSSLSLIKELPWDVLKIDRSILQGAQKDGSRDQLMFKAIISMANTMGLECIVEGVETKDDVKILKESGCFMAQGYYFSKPKPKEEFEALLSMAEL